MTFGVLRRDRNLPIHVSIWIVVLLEFQNVSIVVSRIVNYCSNFEIKVLEIGLRLMAAHRNADQFQMELQ